MYTFARAAKRKDRANLSRFRIFDNCCILEIVTSSAEIRLFELTTIYAKSSNMQIPRIEISRIFIR